MGSWFDTSLLLIGDMDKVVQTTSSLDTGTFYQLHNILNRWNVPTDVSKDMNACEDFLQLITQAHLFAAAMQHLHCSSVTELRTKITDQALFSVAVSCIRAY